MPAPQLGLCSYCLQSSHNSARWMGLCVIDRASKALSSPTAPEWKNWDHGQNLRAPSPTPLKRSQSCKGSLDQDPLQVRLTLGVPGSFPFVGAETWQSKNVQPQGGQVGVTWTSSWLSGLARTSLNPHEPPSRCLGRSQQVGWQP